MKLIMSLFMDQFPLTIINKLKGKKVKFENPLAALNS